MLYISRKQQRDVCLKKRGGEARALKKSARYTSLAKMDSGCDPLLAHLDIVFTEL